MRSCGHVCSMETVLSDMEIKLQSHKDDPAAKKDMFFPSEATDQIPFVLSLIRRDCLMLFRQRSYRDSCSVGVAVKMWLRSSKNILGEMNVWLRFSENDVRRVRRAREMSEPQCRLCCKVCDGCDVNGINSIS